MNLPSEFQFSQSSLQDFVDCPRRFYLRYVERLNFPAVEAAPVQAHERHMQRGEQFHRLVHQHQIGIPVDILSASINDDQVAQWWQNYLAHGLDGLPARRKAETALSVPFAGRRLLAKYDLVAVDPGQQAVIVDWKTSLRPPRRNWYAGNLQTIVYPYVLVGAGAHLNGGDPVTPAMVEMRYWFPQFPDQPITFAYSADRYAEDRATLAGLAVDIAGRDDDAEAFERTDDIHQCQYCVYRSLCQRGEQAGDFTAMEADDESDDFAESFDLDQIAEIAF